MAKRKDITDKLTFDGNPMLIIKGEELEVNADAPTMLKVMNYMSEGSGVKIDHVKDAYELIFPEKSRKKIDKMKLNTRDWMTVIEEAMSLIAGEEDGPGEQ